MELKIDEVIVMLVVAAALIMVIRGLAGGKKNRTCCPKGCPFVEIPPQKEPADGSSGAGPDFHKQSE